MSGEIRVVIADDHPVFRHGLKQVVEAERDIRVLAAVADGVAALACIRESTPDVAVLDLEMPGLDGIAIAQQLLDAQARTRVMLLTIHNKEAAFERAMAVGVTGYVLKDAALLEIVQAIRVVAGGRTYLSPALSDYVIDRAFPSRRAAQRGATPLAALTQRELQILRLIADSQTSREIAALLGLSHRTVENLRVAMSQKLRLQGSHALVKFAFEHKADL